MISRCTIDGCEQLLWCKGFCRHHYNKQYEATHRNERREYKRILWYARSDRERLLEENRIRSREWNRTHKQYKRETNRQHLYGITQEEFDALLKAQDGRCAICRSKSPGMRKGKELDWHVDHDHITNIIRGLLCCDCNLGIAKFHDNPVFCMLAANYLFREREVRRGGRKQGSNRRKLITRENNEGFSASQPKRPRFVISRRRESSQRIPA